MVITVRVFLLKVFIHIKGKFPKYLNSLELFFYKANIYNAYIQLFARINTFCLIKMIYAEFLLNILFCIYLWLGL
jgi:hypothetical protein